jgi:hypothetical protein
MPDRRDALELVRLRLDGAAVGRTRLHVHAAAGHRLLLHLLKLVAVGRVHGLLQPA